jgi:nitroimidazol reductase NimA-like FMN-containing flavoprotein (pyridoxamine 5'-phosphate oxidase superfamily)
MRYHIRRIDKVIIEEEKMSSIMRSIQYTTTAMAKENELYLVFLSHSYDTEENCIYYHCARKGKKLDYLEANNMVWGQSLIDRGYSKGGCNHLYVLYT